LALLFSTEANEECLETPQVPLHILPTFNRESAKGLELEVSLELGAWCFISDKTLHATQTIRELCDLVRQISYSIHVYHGHGEKV
jgi:hypothetical protein